MRNNRIDKIITGVKITKYHKLSYDAQVSKLQSKKRKEVSKLEMPIAVKKPCGIVSARQGDA